MDLGAVFEKAAWRRWHSRAGDIGRGGARAVRIANTKVLREPWGFPSGGRGTWKKNGICRGLGDPGLGKETTICLTQLRNDVRMANGVGTV